MAVHDLCGDTRRKPEYNNAVHNTFITQVSLKVTQDQKMDKDTRPQYRLGRSLRVTLYGNFDIDVLHCAFDPQDKVRHMHEKQGIKLYQVRGDIYKSVRPAATSSPIWFRSPL